MAKTRVEWVDAAKGIAILLVVLFHATAFLGDAGLSWYWRIANPLLETFRMPLFFFASGLFASASLALPFTQMFRRRAWPLLWLYLLWTAVYVVVTQVLPWGWAERPRPQLSSIATAWLMPNASIWFIYALFLYSVAAWLMRRLPVWAQLGMAGLLSLVVGSDLVAIGDVTWSKIAMYFVFFLAARHFRTLPDRLPSDWRAWPALAGYGAAAAVATAFDLYHVPGVRLVLSIAAIVAGAMVARALVDARGFGWLRWLGKRTLPIYVLHYYPIFLLVAALASVAEAAEPFAAILPPAVGAIAVLSVLALYRVLERVPMLWTAPGQARGRVGA